MQRVNKLYQKSFARIIADVGYSEKVKNAWAEVLQPGIDYMISKYD